MRHIVRYRGFESYHFRQLKVVSQCARNKQEAFDLLEKMQYNTQIVSPVSLMVELRLYMAVAAVQFCHGVPKL